MIKRYLFSSANHLLLSITHPRLKEGLRSRQIAQLDPTQLLFSSHSNFGELLLIRGHHLSRSNSPCILGENSHTAVVARSRNVTVGECRHAPNRNDWEVESLDNLAIFPNPDTPVLSPSHP